MYCHVLTVLLVGQECLGMFPQSGRFILVPGSLKMEVQMEIGFGRFSSSFLKIFFKHLLGSALGDLGTFRLQNNLITLLIWYFSLLFFTYPRNYLCAYISLELHRYHSLQTCIYKKPFSKKERGFPFIDCHLSHFLNLKGMPRPQTPDPKLQQGHEERVSAPSFQEAPNTEVGPDQTYRTSFIILQPYYGPS